MTEEHSNQTLERQNKRIQAALPIRITYWDAESKPAFEIACTYDISERGARVTGLRCVKDVGEIIAVEILGARDSFKADIPLVISKASGKPKR